jgi:hypothetical protein
MRLIQFFQAAPTQRVRSITKQAGPERLRLLSGNGRGLALFLASLLCAGPVFSGNFVVNDLGSLQDKGDPGFPDGRCETVNDTCTLNAAIFEAKQSPGPHTITVNVNGTIVVPATILPNDLTLTTSNAVTLQAQRIRVSERSELSGFRIEGDVVVEGADSVVENNVITRGPDGSGVLLVGVFRRDGSVLRGDRAIIRNNVFFNTQRGGTTGVIDVRTNDVVVQGNIVGFDESGAIAPGDPLIFSAISARGDIASDGSIVAGSGLTIADNRLYGYRVGLNLTFLQASEIRANKIGDVDGMIGAGASGLAPLGTGIYSRLGSDNTFIENISNGHDSNGIALLSSTNAVVIDNEFSDNGNAGIVTTKLRATDPDSAGYVFELNKLVNNGGLAIDVLDDGIVNNTDTDGLPNPPSIVVTGENGIQRFEGAFLDPEFAGDGATVCFSASTVCPNTVTGQPQAEFPLFCESGTVDAAGELLISAEPASFIEEGRFITASVTTPLGTSELSDCAFVPAVQPPAAPLEFQKVNAWVVNPKSSKALLGVFLGSEVNDVSTIDLDGLRLGEAPASDISAPDYNDDGFVDLLVRFRTRETGVSCGDETLRLTGEYALGAFERELEIRTVGCSGKGKGKG